MTRVKTPIKPSRQPTSPDPLALGSGSDRDLDLEECITFSLPPPSTSLLRSTSTPPPPPAPARTATPQSRIRKSQPVVAVPSPKKRRISEVGASGERRRTPLKKSEGASNRGTPTPRAAKPSGSAKGKEKATAINHTSVTPSKPFHPSHQRHSSLKGTPTLGSSVGKSLPTPSPAKRPRVSSPASRPSQNLFDTFTDVQKVLREEEGGGEAVVGVGNVSRETFLSNELLRRQREARNFVFDGDVEAPTSTRSGKVIGGAGLGAGAKDTEDEDGNAYGEDVVEGDEMDVDERPDDLLLRPALPPPAMVPPAPPAKAASAIPPLPPLARHHLHAMLHSLTSTPTLHPEPFSNEPTNDALQGVVALLRGTVERGEGNSALLVGARGVGKTRTVNRALDVIASEPVGKEKRPVVVRLNGLAQTDDRKAIREMGRQIAEAEGRVEREVEGEEEQGEGVDDEEYAPTTLPSHLLALLTAPSPRAIIIVMEEFDLFTEHARQALLYCLLDVVQSIKTGPVETTGRGVAVIGLTSRLDTLLLLEKRVKSRFSHRIWRVISPLAPGELGWAELMKRALIPWEHKKADGEKGKADKEGRAWMGDWSFAVETLLGNEKVRKGVERLVGLTTDVRLLYRPFIPLVTQVLSGTLDYLSVPSLTSSILHQLEASSWGLASSKLARLPHPTLGVLIIAKHLSYAGRDEFTFAQLEEEYLRFARTKLVGSGRQRWSTGVLRMGFDHALRSGMLVAAGGGGVGLKRDFRRVRKTMGNHEIVAWCRGEGGQGLGPELASWGRMMGGHA